MTIKSECKQQVPDSMISKIKIILVNEFANVAINMVSALISNAYRISISMGSKTILKWIIYINDAYTSFINMFVSMLHNCTLVETKIEKSKNFSMKILSKDCYYANIKYNQAKISPCYTSTLLTKS